MEYLNLNTVKKEFNNNKYVSNHDKFIDLINYFVDFFFARNNINHTYKGIGRPPYDLKKLTKVVILGFNEGVISGRNIAKQIIYDSRYNKLLDGKTPCYRVINNFKKNNHEMIHNLFVELVEIAKYNDLFDLKNITIDGTKIRARASKINSLKIKEIDFLKIVFQEKEIKEIISKLDNYKNYKNSLFYKRLVEKAMELLYQIKDRFPKDTFVKGNKLRRGCINFFRKSIQSINDFNKNIMDLLELEKILYKSGQSSVSITDSDARWMKNKDNGGMDFNYNVQVVTDVESGFIIHCDVIQNPVDVNSLIPEIKSTQDNLKCDLSDSLILADNGYYNEKNLDFLEENGIDGLIPNRHQSMKSKNKNKENKPFGKVNFTYDHKNNAYICPNNKILPYKQSYYRNGSTTELFYTDDCRLCSYQIKCAGRDRYKVITDYTSVSRRKMAKAFDDDEKNEMYKKRNVSEIIFANLKKNYKYTQTDAYGLKNVKTEVILFMIAVNLKKIFKKVFI